MVKPSDTQTEQASRSRRALIEVTPELQRRLRDPRVILGWAAIVGGAIALLIGYWGVSDTLDTGKQMPYVISGGLGGIFLLGVGTALLFAAELGETHREISEVRELIEGLYGAGAGASASAAADNGDRPTQLVALPRANTFHTDDCVVIADKKAVAAVTRAQIERRGLTPCRLCAPVA